MEELLVLAESFGTWDLLKSQDKQLFESSNYEDVQQDLNVIQTQREIAKTMMNMKRIHPFLAGMSHLEKVLIHIRFQDTAKVMAYIWGPIRFLLKTTNLTDRAFDKVLEIYERLGIKIPPLYEYVQLFTRLPECELCLVYTYQDVLTFHKLAYKLFSLRPNLWQKLHTSTWKAFNPTFEHLVDSLEKHGRFIREHGSSLGNLQANLNQDDQLVRVESRLDFPQDWEDTKQKFYSYCYDINESRNQFEQGERDTKEDKRKEVMTWISASKKTQSLHKKFQDMRICPNTGRWLFRKYSEVTEWMKEDQPPESAIWLHGIKGFGKTVLASLLIDELKKLCTEEMRHAIPRESKTYYFYCQEEDPEHRTFLDILKGILHQMVNADDDLLPFCVEHSGSGGSTTLSNPEIAQDLIETFFEYNVRQYIIIDGLDECEHTEIRQTVNYFMGQITKCDSQIRQGQLRVLFISQPITDLPEDIIMPEDDARVQLKSTDNADDIRDYVKKRVPDFSKKGTTCSGFNLSDGDEEQIESIICSRSENMFLYAHLAIEYLLQQPTKEKLLEKIKQEMLPRKLSELYEKLLGTVKTELLQLADGEDHWHIAKLLLGWLVCAKRSLKWHEMQSILSYDSDRQEIDLDKKMLRQKAKTYLGSLVHVLDGGHIRIIHSTARRYVIQNEHINGQTVQCELTILCLRYLCLLSLSSGYDEYEHQYKTKLGWFSFQDYACAQWESHIVTMVTEHSNLFFDRNHGREYEEKFDSALQYFIETHRANLTENPHPDLEQTPPEELAGFSGLSFYDNLRFLWNHIYTHQRGTYDIRNTVGIAKLDDALQKNRATLEENFKPNSEACINDTIEDYYGPNLFKCKRVLCKFFYHGFDRKKDRETHDKLHDRPFRCPVNCDLAPIGFSSHKDKERHVRTYHPEQSEGPSVFEALRLETSPRPFTCKICGNSFTRNITLKGHMRSHFGERPYECSQCGKSFARLNDCRRHEKIHSRIRM